MVFHFFLSLSRLSFSLHTFFLSIFFNFYWSFEGKHWVKKLNFAPPKKINKFENYIETRRVHSLSDVYEQTKRI